VIVTPRAGVFSPPVAKHKVQSFFDARGRLLVERRGLPSELGSTLANDAYHFMRTATWTRIFLLFGALFVVMNLAFGVAYWWDGAIANAEGFLEHVWFSVQTIATIGYGGMTPTDTLSNTLVAIESFLGIIYTALVTGVFFSRFATPSARVIFSTVAVIHEHDGKRMLMFRMANARATAIVEATVHVYLSRDEVLADGEHLRRIHDLSLRRNVSPIFALSWTAYHELDESSPLHGITPDSLLEGGKNFGINIIVTFQGTDDRLASTVHTRWAYNPEDLVFDKQFSDIIKLDKSRNVRYLDFTQFHATEPLRNKAA
jgi:inward rectifier potassium channel